ncbi:MAG: PAS domain S-box protein [Nitrospina sp.]|nr:PAS domain S-box protein [Nitrospina sp.]
MKQSETHFSFLPLVVVAVFVGIWQLMVVDELQFIKSDIKSKHEVAIQQILFEVKERALSLERMGKRFEVNFYEDQHKVEWEADVINYVNHFGNFKSLDWVDSDYRVQWSVAPDGNEKEYGMNLMDDPRLAPALNVARESRDSRVSPVLNAPQQEKVFSVFVPLFEEEEFIGFIRGKFVLESFLQNIFTEEQSGIQLSIYSDGKVLYSLESGETGDPKKWLVSSTVEYKGLNWIFQSIPGKAYLSKLRTVTPEVVMAFGLILAWALGAAVRGGQKARKQKVELTAINEKLKEEFNKSLQQSQALELSQNRYKNLFSQVSKIIAGMSKKTGEQFFASLVQNLSASLGFKYCLLGELDPMDDGKIRALALGGDSGLMENITYALNGTPCENVVGKTLCTYPSKVWKMFPEDKMLCDLGIESYAGVPLNDSSNNPLGILCAMHDEPVTDFAHANLILSLFAGVAEAEVERQRYEKAFLKESALVRLSKNIAVTSNDLPDMESILEFSLRKICEFIKWPVGHFYMVDEPMRGLISYPVWYLRDSQHYAWFRSITEELYFEKGEGLPGRVMAESGPAWIPDLWHDPNFPRSEVSREVGLRTGMAIPIMVGEKVGGVMEFFTDDHLELDQVLLKDLAPIGTQLGRVLERARSESLLKKQALVLDQIHDAVISMDSQHNITAWNMGAERVFGFEEQEMLGKPFTYLFPDEEKKLQQTLIQPTIINGTCEIEMEAVQKSGGFIHVHISLSALCDQDCLPQSIVCYALDITEKKHAREQLEVYSQDLEKRVEQRTVELNTSVEKIRESRDQIEGILKSIGEGLLVTDCHGKMALMNPAAENILGLKKEDVLGQYVSQVLDNQSLLACWDIERKDKSSSQSFGFELAGKDQGRKFIRGASTLLLGENDEAIG